LVSARRIRSPAVGPYSAAYRPLSNVELTVSPAYGRAVRRTRHEGPVRRAAPRGARGRPRARRPVRTGPTCRPVRPGGGPTRLRGRTRGPGSLPPRDSASRPGPGGRRCW
jgi:hypothetical protein